MRIIGTALAVVGVLTSSQDPGNLLVNGDASQGLTAWIAVGNARVEGEGADANFVLRNKGSLQQTVRLRPDAAGQYLVVLARGLSERVNADGAITGLPYLYGLVIGAEAGNILGYLQGQRMRATPSAPDRWTEMAGGFLVPAGAARVVVQLGQAERAGVPQNGSAARFDDVRVFLVPSASEAAALTGVREESLQVWRPSQPARAAPAISPPEPRWPVIELSPAADPAPSADSGQSEARCCLGRWRPAPQTIVKIQSRP